MARGTAEIDLGAIRRNCATLDAVAPGSLLCAVVKANGYGHGMVPVANAALEGGAGWLGVAAAAEALELREAGVGSPILVMGSVESGEVPDLVGSGCDLVVWTDEALGWATDATGLARLHVKLDSGMGRLGTRDHALALSLAEQAEADPGAELVGVTTHFATAELEDQAFLEQQNSLFSQFSDSVKHFAPNVLAHAANSAATLARADTHHDMVRCGVAIYGLDPFQLDPSTWGLDPAMRLTSSIASVELAQAGDTVGYGRNFKAERPTWIATVPVGYADGISRHLGGRADCLVGGRRVPIVGNVSMDNIALDLGTETEAEVGDQVVLLGRDGEQLVLAEEWATAAGTINYEIATGIGGRTEFVHRSHK